MLHRHILSTGMSAFPADCDRVPFGRSHICASGNPTGDMCCNAAESTRRTLAVRLYKSTSDPGMQGMLSYLIARDMMYH
ncbi:manganese catalase family protein [Bradyrhizobium sp. Gha]|uniref:manganese catalase family protein n=1 Tax=Bradyrhizobium sp. Gha TaxID=1855318 RepID=UPI0008EF15E8|nr:manganese catalase family protein [Bradyrhizobium sp. Gha]SFJ72523.1 Mn-containing catalase [Bradyrhizobium sp. Gha]